MAAQMHSGERSHPTPMKYVGVAVVLAAITGVEVWAVYQQSLRSVLVPILIILSAVKFSLVAMFFMHLRFDNRLFAVFFTGGLILATGVLFALATLFRAFFS